MPILIRLVVQASGLQLLGGDKSVIQDPEDVSATQRMSPDGLSQLLVRLFDERFGGASSGRFRISRKFLRKLAGRRKLPDAYLAVLTEAMFEAGYVFVDCESYSIVLSQKQFASYRRVTALAMNRVMCLEATKNETGSDQGEGSEPSGATETEESFVESNAKNRCLGS